MKKKIMTMVLCMVFMLELVSQVASGAISNAAVKPGANEAYINYIKKNAYNWWAIKDFNGDGQPELICDYSFLHYKDGKVRDVWYQGAAEEWVVNPHYKYYYSKKKCIGISFANSRWNGTAIVKYNGNVLVIKLLRAKVRDGGNEYYVGNKKVSKCVYKNKLKRYNASGKKKIKLTYVS